MILKTAALRIMIFYRVNDDDPRCGISSMQKFDGEDLNFKVSFLLSFLKTKPRNAEAQ